MPYNFKPKSCDGLGYDDVSRWYDKVEELTQVFGTDKGLETNPGRAFLGPPPKDGVTNSFVIDGGTFVSNPYKNPTLTILAMTWRAGEYAMAEMRRGNIG